MRSILVIGAKGQIGTVLTQRLQAIYGTDRVIAADLREDLDFHGIYEQLDVTRQEDLNKIIQKYNIGEIYHLAAILSAKGEENPLWTWELNMKTLFHVLEAGRIHQLDKIFFPSSIAVFGDEVVAHDTPQNSFLNPSTVYGISKAAGENWAQYYYKRYGLDVRSIRYPGIIGHQSMPGGGTTDYAVDIYHKAVLGETFTCFLKPDTRLPLLYMEDAIAATLQIMQAPAANIRTRTSYNLAGFSISPRQIANSIRMYKPGFEVHYAPDHRQAIADSWPNSINDQKAEADWGWKAKFDLNRMTMDMLFHLSQKYYNFAPQTS